VAVTGVLVVFVVMRNVLEETGAPSSGKSITRVAGGAVDFAFAFFGPRSSLSYSVL
jgi:hypothetical protein